MPLHNLQTGRMHAAGLAGFQPEGLWKGTYFINFWINREFVISSSLQSVEIEAGSQALSTRRWRRAGRRLVCVVGAAVPGPHDHRLGFQERTEAHRPVPSAFSCTLRLAVRQSKNVRFILSPGFRAARSRVFTSISASSTSSAICAGHRWCRRATLSASGHE